MAVGRHGEVTGDMVFISEMFFGSALSDYFFMNPNHKPFLMMAAYIWLLILIGIGSDIDRM